MTGGNVVTPEVTWAQRSSSSDPEKNLVFLTVFAPDVPTKELKVALEPTKLAVTGASTTKGVTYHVELEFFAPINVKESKTLHTARDVVFQLRKEEAKEEYWPRLTKDSKKLHFLKTDFDRWLDEDEQEEAVDDDMMGNFGGAGGADGGFGGIDFSKLGGAGGMPDMSALGDMSGLGGEGDEEMPDLEDEEEDAAGKGKEPPKAGKIEEIS